MIMRRWKFGHNNDFFFFHLLIQTFFPGITVVPFLFLKPSNSNSYQYSARVGKKNRNPKVLSSIFVLSQRYAAEQEKP